MSKKKVTKKKQTLIVKEYNGLLKDMIALVEESKRAAARTVNSIMTAAYWEIGRRIVENEQAGRKRAGYGEELLKKLSADLKARFGRGFSPDNLENMRRFYLTYNPEEISETPSRKLKKEKSETSSRKLVTGQDTPDLNELSGRFTLPWSAYVRLISLKSKQAREFYEQEAVRGGWSVRQLNRQIESQFYERTALSKNKAAMLIKGAQAKASDKRKRRKKVLIFIFFSMFFMCFMVEDRSLFLP